MRIITHCNDRKEMVKAISEHLGIPAEYMRMPTRAYRIGGYTVNADNSIDCPQGDADGAAELMSFLKQNGFIGQDEAPADLEADVVNEPVSMTVIVHNHGLDTQGLIRMVRMIYSRQHLICAMLQTDGILLDEEMITRIKEEQAETTEDVLRIFNDCVRIGMARGITLTDADFGLILPNDEKTQERWRFGSVLMNAMVDRCRTAQRVNAKPEAPAEDEMKYFARAWLIQLGFGGAEHAELRHALLDHLKGYAAFRTNAEMEAHNARYAALRRQRREETAGQPDLEADEKGADLE